jgi:hypothetical protein
MTFKMQQHPIFSAGIRGATRIQVDTRKQSENQSEAIRSQIANPATQDNQSSKATLERQP